MKVLERALLSAATAMLFCCSGAHGQSTGNLLSNPDMVVDAYDGHTSRTVTTPFGGAPLVFGGSAAADWAYVSVQFAGSLTIDTELAPSDFIAGNQMLHVRAHNVNFVQLRPMLLDASLEYGHRATFCAWVKVVQGGQVAVAADDTTTNAAPTGDWQQLVDYSDHTTPNGPAITVGTRVSPGDTGIPLGDVDFYVATADYTPRMLTSCPRATLNDLSGRRDPVNLPPQRPRVERPEWTDRPDERPDRDDREPVEPSYRPPHQGKPHDQSVPAQNAPWGQK